jgi:hypothetical protein
MWRRHPARLAPTTGAEPTHHPPERTFLTPAGRRQSATEQGTHHQTRRGRELGLTLPAPERKTAALSLLPRVCCTCESGNESAGSYNVHQPACTRRWTRWDPLCEKEKVRLGLPQGMANPGTRRPAGRRTLSDSWCGTAHLSHRARKARRGVRRRQAAAPARRRGARRASFVHSLIACMHASDYSTDAAGVYSPAAFL